MQNLIDRIADGRLPNTEIAIVIASRSDVEGVARAERAQLPCEVICVKNHPEVEKFSDQISLTLDIFAVNLVVQAGWMCYRQLPNRWLKKAINVHPSLLPKYGGKGSYGNRVHEAVLAAGDTETGATVHWVNNEYDAGKSIHPNARGHGYHPWPARSCPGIQTSKMWEPTANDRWHLPYRTTPNDVSTPPIRCPRNRL